MCQILDAGHYLHRQDEGCAANGPTAADRDRFGTSPEPVDVFGGRSVSQVVALPDELGGFRLCAYASREGHEGDPDLVRDLGPVEIGRPQVAVDLGLEGVLRPGQGAVLAGRVSSDHPVGLSVQLNDATVACRATGPANEPFDQLGGSGVPLDVDGERSVREPVTVPLRIGQFRLCAYASRDGHESDPDLVRDLGTVTVGRPVVALDAGLEGILVPGGYATVVGSVSADAPVSVQVQLNHQGDACAATGPGNLTRNRFATSPEDLDVAGGEGRAFRLAVQLPQRAGTYHLCVYAAREGAEADPDLVLDTAGRPGGLWLVQPQSTAIGEVLYANGTAGTVKVRCDVPNRRLTRGRLLRFRCPHATGALSVSYRRIAPPSGPNTVRRLRIPGDGRLAMATRKMRPGLYRVRITWKGWLVRRTTVRIKPRPTDR